MDFITTLQGLDWAALLEVALQAVGLFSLVATMTNNASDNVIADFLLRAINTLGGNVGKAKNV
jgi:D-alanyl-D-alanine carboxypeptidase|tara:strand:- start:267 stop:455 length:189 start_codon:yes stop_codon:yes gene_type:complete